MVATAAENTKPRHVRINLSKTHLPDADLSYASLAEADFRGANLPRADFQGAKLRGANFSGARLVEAKFDDADLGNANFSKSDLSSASLVGANLEHANFERARLDDTDCSGVDLSFVVGITWQDVLSCIFDDKTLFPEYLLEDNLFELLEHMYSSIVPRLLDLNEYRGRTSDLLSELNKLAAKVHRSTISRALRELYSHQASQPLTGLSED